MKCPKCGRQIGHLVNLTSGSQEYNLNKNGEYMLTDFNPDGVVNEYICPECSMTLFDNEVDALTFVKEG